jgi:hypothetical protein
VTQPEPVPTALPQRGAPRRFRFPLRHLMIAIALLGVVLALAIQLHVIRRQKAELARWGASLRERERYLHRIDGASRRATKVRAGVSRDHAATPEGAPRASVRPLERTGAD